MGQSPLSVKIVPDALSEHLLGREFVYLVTHNGERSHVVALRPTINGATLRFEQTGRTPLANVASHQLVTLMWAPCDEKYTHEHARYSVVADGVAVVDGEAIIVTVMNAVLHRPA
ncbi:MAG: hypothetical protein NTW34_05505 [Actinobacteria bacterium]|nr:hypothetical protein [Actinomycetota bacterium]